jgi:hypothetical protein
VTAGLLREAAAVLRERAAAVHPGPWTQGANYGGVVAALQHDGRERCLDEGERRAYGGCLIGESMDSSAQAYVALMHPPVAVAVADLLDAHSAVVDGLNGSCGCYQCQPLNALARAVLREVIL